MQNQIGTNEEQSIRLIAAGLKPETADIVNSPVSNIPYTVASLKTMEYTVLGMPSWSLNYLINLLPDKIEKVTCRMFLGELKENKKTYKLNISKSKISYVDFFDIWDVGILHEVNGNLFQAATDMICFLVKEEYLKL